MKKGISILLILAMLCGLLLSAAGESKSGKGVELDVEDIELSPDGLELILDDGIPVEGGGALLEPEDLNQDAVALEQQEEFTVQEEPSGATSLDDFYIVEGRVIDYWGNDEEVVIPDHGEDGIAVYKIEYAFSQNSRIKKVTIPEGVSIIGTEAFRNCTNLEEVIIPSTVRAIESYAFFDCASLETLTIPASSIGWEAFAECTKLESVKFLNKVNEIGECAFNKCSSLKRLTLPDGLDCIEGGLFNGCTSLQEVTIPDSVASIGYHVFSGCSSLKRLTVPKKVSLIGHWFYDCTSLESVTIHKNVTEIYTNVFDTCPNVTLYVEAGSYAEEYAKRIGVRYKIIQPDDIFIDQGSSATLYMGEHFSVDGDNLGNRQTDVEVLEARCCDGEPERRRNAEVGRHHHGHRDDGEKEQREDQDQGGRHRFR